MPKNPEDIDMSLGAENNTKGRRAQTEEENEDLSSGQKGKKTDNVPITSTFNTLNPLSWPH